MKIECKILPVTTVEVLIKDGDEVFWCDVPIPNELMEDKEYNYESHAIDIAKESYRIYTEPEEEPSEDELPEQLKVHAEIDEFLEAAPGDHRVELARQKVYQYITQEFLAQDDKWGALRDQSGYIWLTGITEECGEAAETLLKGKHWYLTKAELIQVAALVVNWIISAEHWLDKEEE